MPRLSSLICLVVLGSPCAFAQTYYTNTFESDTVGQQPEGEFRFTPGSNSSGNGATIVGTGSTPAALEGERSLYLYDFVGDLTSGEGTHWRGDFAGGENVSNVRADFVFRRGTAAVDANDPDTRFHFALGRATQALNNSDFRPFELRIVNNGDLVVNSIDGSVSAGTHNTNATNTLTVLANSHDSTAVAYSDPTLGSGSVAANSVKVFLNGADLGQFTFHQTPDPTNAPEIDFYASNTDLGQFAFYQDSKRQGELVVDNLLITSLTETPTSINAPTGLAASAPSTTSVQLTWSDNADNEQSYGVERDSGAGFVQVADLAADTTSYLDTGLTDNTTYSYRIVARAGITSSDPSNVVMIATPEQITPLVQSIDGPSTVATGENAMVSVTAVGRAPLTYQWYRGNAGDVSSPIAGATSASVTLSNLTSSVSVWARVTNGSGSDDSSALSISVRVPGSVVVNNSSELEDALENTGPGDVILLANGTWNDAVIRLTGQGTSSNPITVGAETPGQVILTGESRAQIGGRYTVLRDLVFTGTYTGNDDEVIQFRNGSSDPASFARVTNVAIIDYVPADGGDTDWVSFYGTNNRLDHSYLKGHDIPGVTVVVDVRSSEPGNHRIDHNHFDARKSGGGANGWETIRIGVSDTSMSDSATTVEHNLFSRLDGEIEIISNKSGANVYRYNTFLDCAGTLTLRHGNNCRVDSNLFLGRDRDGSGGVRIIGEDHVVVNNHFEGTRARDGAAITIYAGVNGGALNEYFAADRTLVAYNTFMDNTGPAISVGTGFGSRDRTVLPEDVRIANNVMSRPTFNSSSYIIGEAEDDPTYLNNQFFNGPLGLASSAGFTEVDPQLEFDSLRLYSVPAASSPVAGAADGSVMELATDLEGRARDGSPDTGALEVSAFASPVLMAPATAANTGPDFLSSNRDPSTPDADLVNSSVRALSGSGDAILINGFVVGGSDLKSILVRTVGPGLAEFGVTGVMPEPSVKVFNQFSNLLAENTGWETGDADAISTASAQVGAFALASGSADSAVIATVSPGPYTAQVVPADGTGGNVLVEVYDVTTGSGYMVNQSSRGEITVDQEVLIAGFAVSGTATRRALIRAVGPTLAEFGVTAAVSDSELKVFDSAQNEIAANDNWSESGDASEIASAAETLGAFALGEGSADAAVLIDLSPGAYTVHARGVGGAVGTVLLEVYFLAE